MQYQHTPVRNLAESPAMASGDWAGTRRSEPAGFIPLSFGTPRAGKRVDWDFVADGAVGLDEDPGLWGLGIPLRRVK